MGSILEQIVERKRQEVAERRRMLPLADVTQRAVAGPAPRDFMAAIRAPGVSVIAEYKRRSPSAGNLHGGLTPQDTARLYERGGAAAMSVLTDMDFFGGADDDLRAARDAGRLPLLRKDFTIDAWQGYEGRAIGADAVLLIAAILSDAQLVEFGELAGRLGMAALVEVHDERELERALASGAGLIGINNRDLRTFTVSLDTSLRLRTRIPAGVVTVAESGIRSGEDVRALRSAGFDAILVGESLLRAERPADKLRELREAGA